MNEFLRGPIWTSEDARLIWEPRIAEIGRAWSQIEYQSVALRVRDSALLFLQPEQVIDVSAWAAENELKIAVLQEQPLGDVYSAAIPTSGPLGLRVAVSRSPSKTWHRAWADHDDETIGTLLGFPDCCRRFFAETWGAGLRDTTLAQAKGQPEVGGPIGANLLLRWLGVRLVTHLPCSYGCAPTAVLGESFYAVGREKGLGRAVNWAAEMLSWSMSYSALHGVGVVKTPVLRVEFSTDYTETERTFRRSATPLHALVKAEPTTWEDNGFSTPQVMEAAHRVVTAAFAATRGRVVDLGCGDGALIDSLRKRNGLTHAAGIDGDAGRVKRGTARHPAVELRRELIEDVGDWSDRAYDAIIFMPGRLLEMSAENAARVRQAVLNSAKKLVLYAYDDWARDGLKSLCERAGLPIPPRVVNGFGLRAEAGVVDL